MECPEVTFTWGSVSWQDIDRGSDGRARCRKDGNNDEE